ncbi:MAG: hypothetical protein ACR2QH_08725 [Geminicoccaceae bacterium]
MMKNAISAIAAAVLGVACVLSGPVAAQQQNAPTGMQPGMPTSMSMAGFNVPLEPVRVNILDSFGYYQVTPNGNLVLYLIRGLPNTAAMQGILAMFGQGNPYDTRGFYQIGRNGDLVLYPPANLTAITEVPGMVSMFGVYGMPGMYGAMPGMYGAPTAPGAWGAPGPVQQPQPQPRQ